MARPRKRLVTPLADFLDQALKNRGLSHNRFCEEAGLSRSSFSDIKLHRSTDVHGRETIARWAKVLGLTAVETDELYELIQLAYAPPSVQKLVSDLRSRNPELQGPLSRRVAHRKTRYRPGR